MGDISGARPSRSRDIVESIGVGLLVAGLAAVAVGSALDFRPARIGRPTTLTWLSLLLAALVAVGLCLRFVRRTRLWQPHLTLAHTAVAVALALVATSMLRTDWHGGLLSSAMPVVALGALSAAVGSVLVSLLCWPQRERSAALSLRARATATTVTGCLAGAVVAGAGWQLPAIPVEASTAEPGDARASESVPTEVAWSYETGTATLSRGDVVPTTRGLAVKVPDGVVAIDGATGKELWHYRVHRATALAVAASPDGSWVIVELHPRGADAALRAGVGRVVALRGETGEVGMIENIDSGPLRLTLAADVWLTAGSRGPGREVRSFDGMSLADGSSRWRWTVPEGCGIGDGGFRRVVATARVFVFGLWCEAGDPQHGTARWVAVDARTGEEAWSYDFDPLASPHGSAEVELSDDGYLAELSIDLSSGDRGQGLVVVADSGRVVSKKRLYLGVTDSSELGIATLVRPRKQAGWSFELTPLPGSPIEAQRYAAPAGCDLADRLPPAHEGVTVLCADSEQVSEGELRLATRSWSGPDGWTSLPFDAGAGRTVSGLTGEPRLVRFPAATVAWSGRNGRIVGFR
ncbi:PQQ-binding-like beta-propeller repeat protein [Nocardioides daejeonensis]|uniref:PQQ-binding-like beta-propeller repeat protein n=1 Tax=Nocardioides daejeonensis TaxID=1046556 RepID=UPI000D749A69|nr:PQQ-binding-like beta-propeller repeat protein [Nocardioides daejeonensis]